MKYNTLIKHIKNHKQWNTILYIKNADNHAYMFYSLYDFELFIKSHYQNQERFINFEVTYIRNRKEIQIWGKTPEIYQMEKVNLC